MPKATIGLTCNNGHAWTVDAVLVSNQCCFDIGLPRVHEAHCPTCRESWRFAEARYTPSDSSLNYITPTYMGQLTSRTTTD